MLFVIVAWGLAYSIWKWRRRVSFERYIREITGGKETIGVSGYLLHNKATLFLNFKRYILYQENKFLLISPRGKITEIPLTPAGTTVRTAGASLVITTPEQVYILAEVSAWILWIKMITSSSIGPGAFGRHAAEAAAKDHLQGRLFSFMELESKLKGKVRFIDLNKAQSATLDHRFFIGLNAIVAASFLFVGVFIIRAGTSQAPKSGYSMAGLMTFWAVFFLIIYLLLVVYRKRRRVEPSIDKAFRTNVAETLASFNAHAKKEQDSWFYKWGMRKAPFSISIHPALATLLFVTCLGATVGWMLYADKYFLNQNYKQITVSVAHHNYNNCSGPKWDSDSYCYELIDGFVAETGEPFQYTNDSAKPRAEMTPGTIKEYWVHKATSDYGDLSDLDIRSKQPIADGWPNNVFIAGLATTTLVFPIFIISVFDAGDKWLKRLQRRRRG